MTIIHYFIESTHIMEIVPPPFVAKTGPVAPQVRQLQRSPRIDKKPVKFALSDESNNSPSGSSISRD